MSEIKLNPCPFCGESGGVYTFHPNAKDIPDKYWVACHEHNDCAVHPGTDLYETPEEAAEAWNKRHTVDIVETLRKCSVYRFEGRLPDGRICHFSDIIELIEKGRVK